MRIEQLTDVFVKHLGARKDGAAYVVPADTDAVLFVALEGETLSIAKVTRLEATDTLVFLDTVRGERFVVAAEDVRAVRIDKSEHLRKAGAGFGK